MTLDEITQLIDNKIEQNDEKIVVSFYELKVKLNLSEDELNSTISLITIRLTNIGYRVYLTGQKYNYNNQDYIVESNELIVAVK